MGGRELYSPFFCPGISSAAGLFLESHAAFDSEIQGANGERNHDIIFVKGLLPSLHGVILL